MQSSCLSSFETRYYLSTKRELWVSEKEKVERLLDLGRPGRRKRGVTSAESENGEPKVMYIEWYRVSIYTWQMLT